MNHGQRVMRSLSSSDTWTTHQPMLVPCTRPLPSPVTLASWGPPASRDSLRSLISPGGWGEMLPLRTRCPVEEEAHGELSANEGPAEIQPSLSVCYCLMNVSQKPSLREQRWLQAP